MKKITMIFGLILVCFFMFNIDVFASTRVNIRTEIDYLVPSDVIVTESNRWSILNTPAINVEEKVYDFGGLLTDTEETKLYTQIKKFCDTTALDFAIVTIKDNVKDSSRQYAHDFYDYNDFLHNGLLFLIDIENDGIYMVTKGRAVELFPNSRMDPILANVYSKVNNKRYYDACSTFVTSIGEFVDIGVADEDEDVIVRDDGTIEVSSGLDLDIPFVDVFLVALIGTAIIIGFMIMSNRMVRKATSSREFLNKETMKVVSISEMFLGSHTSRTRIDKK